MEKYVMLTESKPVFIRLFGFLEVLHGQIQNDNPEDSFLILKKDPFLEALQKDRYGKE